MSPSLRAWRAAKAVLLLSPALLGGCYVVPVVPVPQPVYRPYYPRPPYRPAPPYRHHGEVPAAPSFAAADEHDGGGGAEGSFAARSTAAAASL